LLLLPASAFAEDRDYCPARPGLGTPACTIAPGHVSIETALGDWTIDNDADQREDTILIGDTLVRVGVTDSLELQAGWTPFGHDRTRDKANGAIDSANRIGDATLGLKANLQHPDGKGLSIAVQPYVTVPVGKRPIGAGDWGGGVLMPVTYDLTGSLNLAFTPEIDAAVDADGKGRHLAYSGTIGLGVALTKSLTATLEFQALRDRDPSGHTAQALLGLSLGWMAKDDLQFDIGCNAGLDHDAPDAELYAGISRRF